MKNNKLITTLLIVFIVLFLGLGIYVIYDKTNGDDNKVNENNNEVTYVKKINKEKFWVYDAKYEYDVDKKQYTTDFGVTYYINNIVAPYINIDSSDAKTANTEIKKSFDNAITKYNGEFTNVDNFDYKNYINNDIISVMLNYTWSGTDLPVVDYFTYNFNIKTGKLLSYEDIYSKFGYTKDSINNLMKEKINEKAAEVLNDEYYKDKLETLSNKSYEEYKNNVNSDKIEYFIDSNNTLNVVVDIFNDGSTGKTSEIISIK